MEGEAVIRSRMSVSIYIDAYMFVINIFIFKYNVKYLLKTAYINIFKFI